MLSKGSRREVHRVPELGNDIVVKVQDPGKEAARLSEIKRLARRLAPQSQYRMIHSEARHQMAIFLAHGTQARLPLPMFRGLALTNRGPAALWEAKLAPDGGLAPTLRTLDTDPTPRVTQALNTLAKGLFDFRIVVSDVNPHNIVVEDLDGTMWLTIIDGFGDPNLIAMKSMVRAVGDRRRHRAMQNLAKHMRLGWDTDRRRFVPRSEAALARGTPHP